MAGGIVDREALTSRILPQMKFSDGSRISTSSQPPSLPISEAGKSRFAVRGNAIVTGGAGNLAMAGARALLEHGLTGLALFDLVIGEESEGVKELKRNFPDRKILLKKVDVADAEGVNEAVEATARELGSVNILCSYAGIVSCMHGLDMDPATFRRTMDVNATGSFICAQAAAKQMVAQKTGGSIMLIASVSASRVNFPQPQVAYNASKCAVLHIKNSFAAEWARYGIRTNTISPGYMDTILNHGDGLDDAKKIWMGRCPLGRMGDPWELTGPLVLLASDAGTYINGADLVVDGGSTVCF